MRSVVGRAVATVVVLAASPLAFAQAIDFTGINGIDLADGNGQTFAWSSGGTSGTVRLDADWTNLPDQNGPIRTATAGFPTFSNPFVGTLTMTFSQPVEVALSATFSSLLRDGLDGGRFERVTLSTTGPVTFAPEGGTNAVYSGVGSSSITADDTFSESPITSIWGFVGTGMADQYTFVYTSSRSGFSETFDVVITSVPEPASALLLCCGLAIVCRPRRRSQANK